MRSSKTPSSQEQDRAKLLATAPSTVPVFSPTGALSPLLLIPMSLPIVLALFAPLTVLDDWPLARHFCEWVQSLMPFIDMQAHARSTVFSQVAWFTHSLTVIVVPLMALVWFWNSMVNYPRLLRRRQVLGRMSLKMHLGLALIAPPLFLGGLYAFIALPGDPSFARGFTTHSRFGLAFLTLCIAYNTAMILGGQVLCARLFIDTYLRKAA